MYACSDNSATISAYTSSDFASSLGPFVSETVTVGAKTIYTRKELLGRGSFGAVFKGTFQDEKGNTIPVAVKKVKRKQGTEREIEALKELQGHPNIIKLYDVEHDDRYVFISLELCDGDLEKEIKYKKDLGLTDVKILHQISFGIQYMHRKGYVHKDLKAENILVCRKNGRTTMKLADFGLCRKLENNDHYAMCTSGNKAHKAPEVLLEQDRRQRRAESFHHGSSEEEEDTAIVATPKVDIFALGCIFYIVLTKGKHPFEKNGKFDYNIKNNKFSLNLIKDEVEARHLIEKMISQTPSERPPIEAVLEHPFFYDDLQRCIDLQVMNCWDKSGAGIRTVFEANKVSYHALNFTNWCTKFNQEDASQLKISLSEYEPDSNTVYSLARAFLQGLHALNMDFEKCLRIFERNAPGCFLYFWLATTKIGDYSFTTVRNNLQRAVELNLVREVEALLDDGVNINSKSPDGKTALHLAVQTSSEKIVTMLVEQGAKWDITDEIGWTPLHYAVMRGKSFVQLLIEKCEELNDCHMTGWTPLHIAASLGLEDIVEYLIDQCPDLTLARDYEGLTPLHVSLNSAVAKKLFELKRTDLDALDKNKNTPLHLASLRGAQDVLKILIEKGGNINATNCFGHTPLHAALFGKALDCASVLINAGADINAPDQNSVTPLHLAAEHDLGDIATALIKKGANVNIADIYGNIPLHEAALDNAYQVAEILIKAKSQVGAKNKNGQTPLHFTTIKDAADVAQLLITQKCKINFPDKSQRTTLHYTAIYNAVKVSGLLLKKNLLISPRDENGLTPLHIAAELDRDYIAFMLIGKGADLNATDKFGFTPLHRAVCQNSVKIVEMLLKQNVDVDQLIQETGITALHMAALNNSANAANLLLEQNIEVYQFHSATGRTALHMAAQKNAKEAASVLLKRGANPNAKAESGLTPVHVAALNNSADVVKLLLEQNIEVDQLYSETADTALHMAAEKNAKEVASLLLESGANPNAKTKLGHTPLHVAALNNSADVADLLLKQIIEVDQLHSETGETALHMATEKNAEEVASLLLKSGADPNAKTESGHTPLHVAALNNSANVADLLLKQIIEVNQLLSETGETALHIAAEKNAKEVASLLLKSGADSNAKTESGYTPLHLAALNNSADVADLLLKQIIEIDKLLSETGDTALPIAEKVASLLFKSGADLNAKTESGYTPLHLAALENSVDVVNLLLDQHIKVDQLHSESGGTALHVAAQKNAKEVASLLIKSGANPNARDRFGCTPLHTASFHNSTDMISLLIQARADVNLFIPQTGLTPLHLAAKKNAVEVAQLLTQNGANLRSIERHGFTPLQLALIFMSTEVARILTSTNQ